MPKDSPDDQALIEAIAKLLNEQNLAEIEIEREDLRVRVTRTYANSGVQQVLVPAAPAVPAAAAPALLAPAGSAAKAAAPLDDLASHPGTLTSPMVGTASLAPEPGAANYVTVGKAVKEGETLLIVEAMKVMNPITAPRAGTVKAILITNEQPVEYDQPLVIIE
jgi:acetyl-CoA carboxylase biotin carboxyl carrier protein